MSRQASAVSHQGLSPQDIYALLDVVYGNEHWHWMPEHASPIEIIVGAILVQHTNWQNAERALDAMRKAGLLAPESILSATEGALVGAIRVSGTPTVKARRLRAVARTIADAGTLEKLLALPVEELRERLLASHGVGPETADAIALYAGATRTFVIDAYTRRVFRRLGIGPERDAYEDWRAFFHNALPDADVRFFQRYHAWIVLHAKTVCRPHPLCHTCPLAEICATGRATVTSPAVALPQASAPAGRSAR